MALKTERLEIRLDAETIGRVDEWRSRQDDIPTRSEALRRLLDLSLSSQASAEFRLSNQEKLMTWLMTEVLKNQLSPPGNDAQHNLETIELIQQAIYGGHFWALRWEMPGIVHDQVDSSRQVSAVVDILDMWSFIETGYERLPDRDKAYLEAEVPYRGKNPCFLGFDGNHESTYLSIARFLVEKMGRFERFKGRSFNSHSPTFNRYSAMARAFENMRSDLVGRDLNVLEIAQLLKIN